MKISRLLVATIALVPGQTAAQTLRLARPAAAASRGYAAPSTALPRLAPSLLVPEASLSGALSRSVAGLPPEAPADAPSSPLVAAPNDAPTPPSLDPRGGLRLEGHDRSTPSKTPSASDAPKWKRLARELARDGRRILRNTPAEVYILGSFGLLVGAGTGYQHEHAREAAIPLGYSEIHQMERDAERTGRPIGAAQRYLAGANDMTAKVFESWNTANESFGPPYARFATELSYKTDPALRIHRHELPDFFKTLPGQAQALREQLRPYDVLRGQVAEVNGHFDRAWNDTHHDNYRTELRTRTVTHARADGSSYTDIETYTEQVYVDTTHTYSYTRQEGEAASVKLDKTLAVSGGVSFNERLWTASQTTADAEYAAEKSRGLRGPLPPEQLARYANAWRDGSTLVNNLPVIHGRLGALRQDADAWRRDKASARDHRYKTASRSDAGPREFQSAERALSDGRTLVEAATEILSAVDHTRAMTPVLEAKIKRLTSGDLRSGEAKKLSKEILELAKGIYAKNFKAGFDVERFRIQVVLILSLLGVLIGGALGFAWDRVGERFDWYRR